ncbi:MAG: hypothetical protein CM1200mP26_07410 [Acidimicrobiales bacterium]|nr:MAG: hypothetical protein CM1200mP26_07410 [Acidimicrobiales bacterium]
MAELLPQPLAPVDDDPGAVAVIWADWQSCSDDFNEVVDPDRLQYKECFVVVRCTYQGQTYSRCVYIWVDKDYAMCGPCQGYPKKLGDIWVTRPVTVGRAGLVSNPAAASALPARPTASTYRSRIHDHWPQRPLWIRERLADDPPPIFPGYRGGRHRFTARTGTMQGYDAEVSPAFTGDVDLRVFESPVEELDRLAPREMIAGYWRSVSASWKEAPPSLISAPKTNSG